MSQSDESEEEFVPRTRDTSTPVTLERFFRILGAAGSQVYLHQGDADSNDDLIEQLVSDYKDMAYVDQPIHVAEWDSNISAPHIYTTFLNELEIREGMAIVDVGSGSGISTAYCAMMAGKTGYVTGIDINKRCVDWSINVLNELHASSEPFRSTAAPTRIVHKDAFIACYEEEFKGKYDRVFVGASCPRARAHSFFQFLKPEGGKVVIPIAPSELSLIELVPESTPCISEIAKVRFTSLDLPSEIDVMQAVLKSRRKERLRIVQMPSTYEQDLVNIEHATLLAHYDTISSSPEDVIEGFPSTSPKASSVLSNLGKRDCVLKGCGWTLHVHSVVLKNRSAYFKAKSESGMKDSSLSIVTVPDHFNEGTAKVLFYDYMYYDVLNVRSEQALQKAETSERHIRECCDVAINLFIMGQALSLGQLTAVSLDFLATHFELVKESESFRSLDAGHIVLIAEEAHNQVLEMKSIMQELRASASYAKQEC
eukprot:jgi/Picre1/31673/NNA_007024.t1